MEVEKVGADTILARIIRMVQEAQVTKPSVQRMADTAGPGTLFRLVLTIAVLTFVYWYFFAAETLLIALSSSITVIYGGMPVRAGSGDPDRGHGRHRPCGNSWYSDPEL